MGAEAVKVSVYVGEEIVVYDPLKGNYVGWYVHEDRNGNPVKVSVGGSYGSAEECFEAVRAAKEF